MSNSYDDNYWYFDWWRFEDALPPRSECSKCKGSGEMPVTYYEGDKGTDAMIDCDRCHGSGIQTFNHERECGLTNDAGKCECPQT